MKSRHLRAVLAATLLSAVTASVRSDDLCDLPPDVGPCDGICPRWFFNAEETRCETFTWGCCGGNANNFATLLACQSSCGCDLPADPGPCDGVFPRWFFNAGAGQCELFTYGGCEGNANNFETLEECRLACASACPADAHMDAVVDILDMVAVIVAWGAPGGAADVNGDGIVGVKDLVAVILEWGPCFGDSSPSTGR